MKNSLIAKKADRGAFLAELALCLPFIMLLAVGIIVYGLSLRHKQVLVDAARAGGRAGAGIVSKISPAPGAPNYLCRVDCGCVTQEAKAVAKNYLQTSGLDAHDIEGPGGENISAVLCRLQEDGVNFQAVQVTLVRGTGVLDSFSSVLPFIPKLKATSTFLLEKQCLAPIGLLMECNR